MPNLLQVKLLGNPVLNQIAEPISVIDDFLKQLIEDMIYTMYETDGIGLAAPQVGVSLRLIVCDAEYHEKEKRKPIIIINPDIIEYEGEIIKEEGCLSLPNVYENIKRFEYIKMHYQDMKLRKTYLDATGLLSICLQHENDHLNGITLYEKINQFQKMSNAFKFKKIKEKGSFMSNNLEYVNNQE
jgi:peptide deformylase